MTTATPHYLFPPTKIADLGSLSLASGKRSSTNLDGTISTEDMIDKIRQTRRHILVVDDDDGFRRSLVFRLEELYNANVVEADTGRAALDVVLAGCAFDLIIMDIAMPVMDGIEACKAMRAQGITSRIALMSAYYDAEKRASARDLGVSQLDKPPASDALEIILLECGEEKTE